MTWEETIQYIRSKPEYQELVEKAYFDADLILNVERFRNSDEYKETVSILKDISPSAHSILDIGSGNGISAIAFALDGYKVTVSEPDPSNTVGAGAIRKLKEHYNLQDLDIFEEFAENIKFQNEGQFDIIYVRQAMHHAYDLENFVKNLSGLAKQGGFLVTIRDHVIYNEEDKAWFLKSHPLHKFYGGENAFKAEEYESAMKNAGLTVIRKIKHYDSVINYFPLTLEEFRDVPIRREKEIESQLKGKIGPFANIGILKDLYKKRLKFDAGKFYDEKTIPGRMYSYIAEKK